MGKVVGKVLKVVAIVAAVASVVATAGTSLGFIAAGSSLFGLGISAAAFSAIAAGASLLGGILAGKSKAPQSETHLGRLFARLDTRAPRKLVLGTTAMPADIRYYEGSGTDEEYIDYILAVAAHKVVSIDQIWFEDTLVWTSTGGVQGVYVGYLTTVTTRLEGTSANTIAINGGARWGSDDRLTGCAYVHLRVKRTGNTESTQSPLASGLPGRVTIIGEGMPQYDPRFDSTAGGVGTMRVADQTTWGASTENPIIQALNALLGWRIAGKLSVGGGIPLKYIDMESVITAANICDENVALAGGGTQSRYRTAGAFSTNDAPMAIVAGLLAGCAGDMFDSEGKLSFLIKTNTLATPVVEFDDHDILSTTSWDAMGGQTNLPNIISGSFTDPSNNSLYQMVPYPSVVLASEDGIERTETIDFAVVEDSARAQRLAKQTLQRMQYPGLFSADYNLKGMAAKIGSIVYQTYSPLGWVQKPFRVISQKPSRSGRIALVLQEENAAIYAWASEDSAAVQIATPVGFDPLNTGPILLARIAGETANWGQVAGAPADLAGLDSVARAELNAAQAAASTAIANAAIAQGTADGKVTTFFQITAPIAEAVGDLWIDIDDGNKLYRWSGSAWTAVQDAGIGAAITAASTAQATADGKIVSFYQATAPIAESVGDLWTDTDDDITYRWSGSAWVSIATLGATAEEAARLAATRLALAGSLPAQFNAANYWSTFAGGPLPTTNLADNALTEYAVDASGRSVVIGPAFYQIGPLADLPISDGMVYDFSFDVEVVADGGGTSAWGFIRQLDAGLVYRSYLIAAGTAQKNILTGQRRTVRFRVGKNVTGVDINITNPSIKFFRVLPLVNRVATGTGSNTTAVTRFFGITGTVESSKLSGIEAGATVGADLLTNVLNKSLANLDSTADTKLDGVETQADVTKAASGTPEVNVGYTSDGVIKASEIPKIVSGYKLTPSGGTAFASGVTWTVAIISGSFSGAAPTMAGTGQGQLTINSGPAVAEVILAITATYNGRAYPPVTTKVKRVQDAAVPVQPTGSAFASANVNLSNSTTTYTVAGTLLVTTGAGVTSVALTAANMGLFPGGTINGNKPCETKWQRETSPGSAIWTDIGVVTVSSPHPNVENDPEIGFVTYTGGNINNNFTDTGRTASTTYSYRLMYRRQSIAGPSSGSVTLGGTISAQG